MTLDQLLSAAPDCLLLVAPALALAIVMGCWLPRPTLASLVAGASLRMPKGRIRPTLLLCLLVLTIAVPAGAEAQTNNQTTSFADGSNATTTNCKVDSD